MEAATSVPTEVIKVCTIHRTAGLNSIDGDIPCIPPSWVRFFIVH